MKQSEYLFYLIKSLSKTEKRYFKLYASRHVKGEENNYVKLFDYIDKQDKYDEAMLLQYFSGERFVKQLSVAKNYLYSLILKSMHVFHSGSTVDARIWELLHNVEFLKHKGLWQQCGKVLNKIKELCVKYERFVLLIEALRTEQKIYKSNSLVSSITKDVDYFREHISQAEEKVKNLTDYDNLSNELYILSSNLGQARSEQQLKTFEKFMSNPLLTDVSKALSFQAKRHFYTINMVASFYKHDNKGAYKYSLNIVKMFHENPAMREVEFEAYRGALIGHAVLSRRVGKREEFAEYLKKLNSLVPKDDRGKGALFETNYNLQFGSIIEEGRFDEGFKIINEFEPLFVKHFDFISPVFKIILPCEAAFICFGAQKISSSLKWLNKVINSDDLSIRKDIIGVVKIFDLIIHYELGNDDLIDYKVRSTYRFLYGSERMYAFENIILKFIKRKLSQHQPADKLIEAFKELKRELEDAFKNPIEAKVLEYFDFMSWLDSKIERKSFAEIVKRKFELRNKKKGTD